MIKVKKPFILLIAISFAIGNFAFSEEESDSQKWTRENFDSYFDIGATVGYGKDADPSGDATMDEPNQMGLVLGGTTHGNLIGKNKWYGQDTLRLKVGNSIGLSSSGMGGVGFFGLSEGKSGLAPMIGLEPFNISFNVDSLPDRNQEDFIEWNPAIAAGVVMGTDTCRLLTVVRGVAGLGTLGKDGFRHGYGAGLYAACGDFNLGADATRLITVNRDVDVANADMAINLSDGNTGFGFRVESITTRDKKSDLPFYAMPDTIGGDEQEVRGVVSIRLGFGDKKSRKIAEARADKAE